MYKAGPGGGRTPQSDVEISSGDRARQQWEQHGLQTIVPLLGQLHLTILLALLAQIPEIQIK